MNACAICGEPCAYDYHDACYWSYWSYMQQQAAAAQAAEEAHAAAIEAQIRALVPDLPWDGTQLVFGDRT